MREGGDTLHFDRVHFFKGVIEDSRCVDHLPSEVLVIQVSDEERLGRERIRLHIDVGAGDLVDERRFPDVWVSAD